MPNCGVGQLVVHPVVARNVAGSIPVPVTLMPGVGQGDTRLTVNQQ